MKDGLLRYILRVTIAGITGTLLAVLIDSDFMICTCYCLLLMMMYYMIFEDDGEDGKED